MPQKRERHQTLQAMEHFFVFKKERKPSCINMFHVIFVSPKFYSVFKGKNVCCWKTETRVDDELGEPVFTTKSQSSLWVLEAKLTQQDI